MTRTLHARFDGEAFYPEEPMPIAPNTRVLLTVETSEVVDVPIGEQTDERDVPRPAQGEPYSSLKLAMALNLEGPEDWSENLDEYLYQNKKFPDE